MRTKALFLTALLGIASIATAVAQSSNVYSVNVVGYVTVTVDNDVNYRILSNPLLNDSAQLTQLIPAAPDFTQVSILPPSGVYQTATYLSFLGGWDVDLSLAPGAGFFIKLGAGGSPIDITFVGEVAQGDDSNKQIPVGLSLQGSLVPQAGDLAALGIPGADFDQISKLPASGVYQTATFLGFLGGWDQNLSFDVAEGFFFLNAQTGPQDWNRDFVVE